ncbi:MAG: hypothetical protein ABIF89_02125 [bacterium]
MVSKNKKIFDIIPPKSQAVQEVLAEDYQEVRVPTKRIKIGWLLALILIIGTATYFLFARVEIEIWPETQAVSLKEEIRLDTEIKNLDFSANRIPAQAVETTQELSEEFSPTGKIVKEEKARGKIRVYNNYSESDQSLVVNTRFLSADGKLFRSLAKVVVPGGTYEKGKLVPGFIDIEVVAAETGESYNIEPSTFSIPGFAGSVKYTAFYGKSFSQMTGGFKGEVSRVTKEDLEKARSTVVAKLFEQSNKILQEKTSQGFVLLGGAVKSEEKEASSSAQEGEETSSFTYHMQMKLRALVFKKADFDALVKSLVLSYALEEAAQSESFWRGKEVQQKSLKTEVKLESLDFDTGTAVLQLEVAGEVYYGINESLLKNALTGKSLKKTATFLEIQPQVKKAVVSARPFWIGPIPSNERKINIKMKIDEE